MGSMCQSEDSNELNALQERRKGQVPDLGVAENFQSTVIEEVEIEEDIFE
jgi:hypothetical protein